jgi:DNA-binding LacI/PurR family transcriptional regulator
VTKRPRQTDVARLAGVSPTTVSLVINNRVGGNVRITEETRLRVLHAVDELGYTVDPAARRLAGGFNTMLGVFTFEPIFPLQHRDFYYGFLMGIEEEAQNQGYDLLLFTSSGDGTGTRSVYRRGVNRLRMADGSILLGFAQNRDEIERLLGEDYPFLLVGRREANAGPVPYVAADYKTATSTVVSHMIAHGHRRIAYVGEDTFAESQEDRRAGYVAAFGQAGIAQDPSLVALVKRPDQVTAHWVTSLLEEGVTAFVAEMGAVGYRLVQAFNVLGLRPPGDFSFATLGDPLVERDPYPDTTTFRIPRQEMGATAVRLLAQMLKGELTEVPQVALDCIFVPGATVGSMPVCSGERVI